MTIRTARRPAEPRRVVARATLVVATVFSVLSLADQAIRIAGLTPPWTAGDHPQGASWSVFGAVSVAAFTAFAVSMQITTPTLPVGAGGRAAGWLLTASYIVLAAVFALNTITGRPDGGIGRTYYVLGGTAFAVMFLSAMLLGAGLLRRTAYKGPAILLTTAAPAVLVTAIIGALIHPTFAHPAIGESLVYVATALLAFRPSS